MLPRDSELARRAAGGDGTAFVRLYDRYSADVFEATLGKARSVDVAADATQAAFLNLLRRPPAMDAPDRDVMDRLQAMALAASSQWRPPAGAGVGWLRSETVAKAGARFDADWSGHLAAAHAPDRTAEVAFAWQASAQAPAESVPAAPPAAEPAEAAVPRRRFRLRTFLPARLAFALPGARSGLPAVGAAAAALALLATSGDDGTPRDRVDTLANVDAARLTPLGAIADAPTRPEPPRKRRPASAGGGAAVAVAHRPGTPPGDDAEDLAVVPARPPAPSTGGRRVSTGERGPAAAETLGVTQEVGAPRGTDRVRTNAKVPEPAPPRRPPAASPAPPPAPAQPAPAPAQPAPAPAEPGSLNRASNSPNAGGVRRNCNSKQSLNPC